MEDTITIKEFRMWLQGVEEMQVEGWVPTRAQWEKIRQKINIIESDNFNAPPTRTQFAAEYPQQPVIYPTQTALAGTIPLPSNMSGSFADNPAVPVRLQNGTAPDGSYQSSFA